MAIRLQDMVKGVSSMPEGTFVRRLGFWLKLTVFGLIVLVVAPASFTYVNPGHVGIVIHRLGGGVDTKPLGPGVHFRNPLLTEIEEYPTYMQTLLLTRAAAEGSRFNEEINVNSM